MQELDLGSKKVLKVKFEGESFDVRFPSMLEAVELGKKTKDKTEAEQSDVMVEFLVKLGLSKKLMGVLDPDAVNMIVENIMPSKKK